MTNRKHTKQSAGSLGGRATVARHGHDHMAKIGRRGGQVTHERYYLAPVNLSHFAMVDRKTNKIKAWLSGDWSRPSWKR